MSRDTKKDNQYFNCREVDELNDLTAMYEHTLIVRKFIINRCQTNRMSYRTRKDVYALIEKELGFPKPV